MEFLAGTGKKKAKVMIVSDNPSDFEYEKDEWMVGKAGNLFKDLLTQIGLNVEEDCYFTGIVKYPTPSDDKGVQRQPIKSEIDECLPYFYAELEIVDPDIIIPLGNVALRYTLGRTGITKFRGKAVEKDDRIIFPIVHPELVFRQPKHASHFTTDVMNLKTLVEDGMEFLSKSDVEYRYLDNLDDIEEEIERLMDVEWLVFDLETTGLSPFKKDSKIVCISLTDKTHYGVTIPLEHKDFYWSGNELRKVKELIKKLLEHKPVKKMGHNGKFDMKWLMFKYGIDVVNYAFDPMIAHYIAVSEERGGHGLKELAWEHTDMGGYDNDLDDYKKEHGITGNYDLIDWEILREYAAADVDCTMRLFKVFKPMIDSHPKWPELFNTYMEGSYALRDMELNGAHLDKERAKEFNDAYLKRIAEIEEKLRQYPEVVQIEREKQKMFERRQIEMKKPKEERDPEILKWNKYKNFKFKFSSTQQLRELLFEKLGLETPFLTEKGKLKPKDQLTIQDYSTGAETLEYLEDKHPIANLLSEWRKLEKLYGTYIKPAYEEWTDNVTGLVHGNFNLVGTVTSRLASDSPNMQNIPRQSNSPQEFQYHYGPKKLFTSRFGEEGVILQFDYSQLELRIAAIFSDDEGLKSAYRNGKDLHKFVASRVNKVAEEEVTDDQRTSAKAVGFGLLYGKGNYSLAQDMGVELDEADEFIDAYFAEFPGMKTWINKMHKQVKEDKYVETLAGFRRRLPAVDSNQKGIQAEAIRQSVNAPIQGTGGTMTLMSVILINKMFKKLNLKSVLAITVHDSIVADVHVSEFKTVFTVMKQIMENLPFDWINVPIVSEAEIGRDYGTLVELESLEALDEYESIFEYIDEKVEEKTRKDYERAGLEYSK